MTYKLLVVNGDDDARGTLARQLGLFGEPLIAEAGSAREALKLLGPCIIEAELPDMSGGDLCWIARRRGLCMPMLVLGDDRESTLVLALEPGADDFLGRPFGTTALLARLRLHLRRRLPIDGDPVAGRFVFFSSATVAANFNNTPAQIAAPAVPTVEERAPAAGGELR